MQREAYIILGVWIIALTRGEWLLIGGAIAAFTLFVGFCVWVFLRMRDFDLSLQASATQAEELERRTERLEARMTAD